MDVPSLGDGQEDELIPCQLDESKIPFQLDESKNALNSIESSAQLNHSLRRHTFMPISGACQSTDHAYLHGDSDIVRFGTKTCSPHINNLDDSLDMGDPLQIICFFLDHMSDPAIASSFLSSSLNSLPASIPSDGDTSLSNQTQFSDLGDRLILRRKRKRNSECLINVNGVLISPKGVYPTKAGNYRVLLNTSSSGVKYSKNVPGVVNALWLYEIKILISDSPISIDSQLDKGNYDSLKRISACASHIDYRNQLLTKIEEFSSQFLQEEEKEDAVLCWRNCFLR